MFLDDKYINEDNISTIIYHVVESKITTSLRYNSTGKAFIINYDNETFASFDNPSRNYELYKEKDLKRFTQEIMEYKVQQNLSSIDTSKHINYARKNIKKVEESLKITRSFTDEVFELKNHYGKIVVHIRMNNGDDIETSILEWKDSSYFDGKKVVKSNVEKLYDSSISIEQVIDFCVNKESSAKSEQKTYLRK